MERKLQSSILQIVALISKFIKTAITKSLNRRLFVQAELMEYYSRIDLMECETERLEWELSRADEKYKRQNENLIDQNNALMHALQVVSTYFDLDWRRFSLNQHPLIRFQWYSNIGLLVTEESFLL